MCCGAGREELTTGLPADQQSVGSSLSVIVKGGGAPFQNVPSLTNFHIPFFIDRHSEGRLSSGMESKDRKSMHQRVGHCFLEDLEFSTPSPPENFQDYRECLKVP